MATYASIDKVMQSMGQVSLYSGLNKAKIISHDDERQQINYGVNQENMMEYAEYLGINPNEISTSYGDYKPRRVRSPPKQHYMVSSGRGKLLSRAFQETGITPEYQTFTKLKRHMSEAGIDSTSNRDVTSAFYEMFKKRDDEIPEESSYASSYSSKQSTTSQSEFSSEEFDDDRFKLDDDNRYKLDENRYKFDENTFKLHEIAFPKTPSPSDLNNNDSKREGRRREERPVKTSVYVPPCRRKQEEVTKPVEIKEEEVSFAELIRQAEERKKAEKQKTVARRKTPSELLADPCWVEKPKEENLGAKPKCRNAVLSQFLPKNEQPVSKPNAIPAGMESDDDLDIFEKDSSPNNEEAPAFSWIPAEKVPIARSLIENFIPEEHQKPKPLTLGDFLNNPPNGGTSKKKSKKEVASFK